MSLTDVNKKNYIRRSDRNLVIPWDDPYPNINAVLTEEQQIFLKTLNIIEAKNRNFEIYSCLKILFNLTILLLKKRFKIRIA